MHLFRQFEFIRCCLGGAIKGGGLIAVNDPFVIIKNSLRFMPLILVFTLFFFSLFCQNETEFLLGLFWFDFLSFNVLDFTFIFFNNFNFSFYSNTKYGFFVLDNTKLNYDYNYRTHFTQTYLHAAYTHHMKPYKNLFNMDRLFGDYNVRTFGKSKKHARSTKFTQLFILLYSHSLECYGFNAKLISTPFVVFYFKKEHLYSVLEMFYAAVYLGVVYFFVFAYVRMVERSSLGLRDDDEIDEEEAQNQWYAFRDDRTGLIEPQIYDNIEVDFAYPQSPYE